MPSLAAETKPHLPDIDLPAGQSLDQRLMRLRDLLGISGVRLTSMASDGPVVVSSIGPGAALSALENQAVAALQPLVLADSGMPSARFYVGIVLPQETDRPAQVLSLYDARPRSITMATTIAALAGEVLAHAALERQRRHIAAKSATIADHVARDEQRRSLFDRASATANIGIWLCDLSDNSLSWTNGVYDLFEIQRDAPVTRDMTKALYTDASRMQMEAARAHAIATCTDFALDCEITTTTGKRRWMRLTGAVESRDGVAVQIFGMKQDITEEKLMADRTRYLAEFDVMTGLANRSQFQARLSEIDAGLGSIGALLLVDLDGFKQINDTFGHALGDECLKQAAVRLMQCCGAAKLVARIGGDEFAVILSSDMSVHDVEAIAATIVEQLSRPVTQLDQTLMMGASVGVAHFSSGSSEQLFRQADTALYAAKAAGRNTRRTFSAA